MVDVLIMKPMSDQPTIILTSNEEEVILIMRELKKYDKLEVKRDNNNQLVCTVTNHIRIIL